MITVAQAAARLNLSQSRLYILISEGRIRANKFGRQWMVHEPVVIQPPRSRTPTGG
jgi:excisionase family DNA binding protein